MRVKDIRKKFINLYKHGQETELIGSSFIADEPYIFGAPNYDYIDREITWYLRQSLNVYDIEGKVPEIWKQVADKDGNINSNYGYLIFNKANYSQYANVLKTLRQSRDSRRGVMIYTRPSMHYDWNTNGMNDFVCTNAVNYFIRNNKLHAVVQMRSNDVVFGYRNDSAWQQYVLSMLAADLDVKKGDMIWQAASLHVYPRHHYLIEEAMK